MNDSIIEKSLESYETPLYLYDCEIIKNKIETLKRTIPESASLFYSVKANPLLGICQLMKREADGAEISSEGELHIALKSGFSSSNIIFSGPGKTEKELIAAIDKKIKIINAESIEEIEIINKISKEKNIVTPIAIRVNPSHSHSNAKIKMTGGISSQFGIEETNLNSFFFKRIMDLKNISLKGFQFYTGTQILDAENLVMNIRYIIDLALKLTSDHKLNLSYLNLGGGFGIPYFPNEKALDMDYLSYHLSCLFKTYQGTLKDTEIVFESGRYLLAESGVFLIKILYAKESKGTHFLICDGGSNFHSSSAFLGRFVRNNFPMYVLGKENKDKIYTVTGPLCTPEDIIGLNVSLDMRAKPGDFIVIEKSGAYGLTYSRLEFLSHSKPMEIICSENKFSILRDKQGLQNMFQV